MSEIFAFAKDIKVSRLVKKVAFLFLTYPKIGAGKSGTGLSQ
jgi:hypothetical protein